MMPSSSLPSLHAAPYDTTVEAACADRRPLIDLLINLQLGLPRVFLVVLAAVDNLADVMVSVQLQRSNVDLCVVVQVVLGQRTHFPRPRGTPHHRLPVGLHTRRRGARLR